jgi:hypothetical protein
MVIHQGCSQTPGGRIRALGFARMGARGRRRGPIPAMCQYQGSPVSVAVFSIFRPEDRRYVIVMACRCK